MPMLRTVDDITSHVREALCTGDRRILLSVDPVGNAALASVANRLVLADFPPTEIIAGVVRFKNLPTRHAIDLGLVTLPKSLMSRARLDRHLSRVGVFAGSGEVTVIASGVFDMESVHLFLCTCKHNLLAPQPGVN